MANKLTTLGYFKKRLRDSGYIVDDLYRGYTQLDPRLWSVVIDPHGASVFCTCYLNDPEVGDSYFEIYDGGQFIKPGRMKIKTNSIEVFITYLVKFNINNKAPVYDGTHNQSQDNRRSNYDNRGYTYDTRRAPSYDRR